MHSKGIMHRDIKLDNLMLVKKKKIHTMKLIDFGLSKIITEE